VGFVVKKVALGQVFSEYFGFLLPHSSSLSSGAGKIGQIVGDVPSGLSLAPIQVTKKKNRFPFIGKDRFAPPRSVVVFVVLHYLR
jgi:hypothetical protein